MKIEDNTNFEIIEHNKDKAQTKFNDDEIRFDVNSLHDSVFKKMVKYYDDISSSPLEFLITSLITTISGIVGKHAYWIFSETFHLYLNIWAVLLGVSTISKKTTSISIVLHKLYPINDRIVNQYNNEMEIYKIKLKEYLSKNKKKDDFLEMPKKPIREYLIFPNDVTIEALSEILIHSTRGMIVHSEFGGFLAQLNRSYSRDSKMILTELYDVPESKEIARATKENIYLTRPYFSILGASTTEWIKEHSSKDDIKTGFFARMLFSIRNNNDKELISVFDLAKKSKESKYSMNISEIYEYLYSLNNVIITADTEAEQIYRQHEKYIGEELKKLIGKNEKEISFKGRLLIYTLKIAALLSLIEKKINGR